MRLDGKVAIITGAGRGIGRQMALEFATAGAKVVVSARTATTIEDAAAEIISAGGEALAVPGDVGIEADARRLVDLAVARFGTVDILVNNAGISGPNKPVAEYPPADFADVVRVNLTGAFLCAHYVAPVMMRQRSGRIVNISSFNGKKPFSGRVGYASSKLGLIGLTRCLAQELGAYNITVNAISPGAVEGERVDEVIEATAVATGASPQQVRGQLESWSPLKTLVSAEDVIHVALFLASDYGQHMTGQDINVTAGVVMS